MGQHTLSNVLLLPTPYIPVPQAFDQTAVDACPYYMYLENFNELGTKAEVGTIKVI